LHLRDNRKSKLTQKRENTQNPQKDHNRKGGDPKAILNGKSSRLPAQMIHIEWGAIAMMH
jgi:hypothetical protein